MAALLKRRLELCSRTKWRSLRPQVDQKWQFINETSSQEVSISRREVPMKEGAALFVRVNIGWGRPFETFFAQAFAKGADGVDITVDWQGSYPRGLPIPRSAIALIEADCLVPHGLARQLETDRLATIATSDSPNQQAAKRALIIGKRPSCG